MAAYNSHNPLLALLFILLAISGQALAGRNTLTNSKQVDKKEPDWLFKEKLKHHGSFYIPGIGWVNGGSLGGGSVGGGGGGGGDGGGSTGSGGGGDGSTGSGGGSSGSYVPGGDDTFVPNPGVEVPNPVGGGIPAPP